MKKFKEAKIEINEHLEEFKCDVENSDLPQEEKDSLIVRAEIGTTMREKLLFANELKKSQALILKSLREETERLNKENSAKENAEKMADAIIKQYEGLKF